MAHRGRLNVLVKHPASCRRCCLPSLEGKAGGDLTAGDVKYQMVSPATYDDPAADPRFAGV